jgi:hypothetical protein
LVNQKWALQSEKEELAAKWQSEKEELEARVRKMAIQLKAARALVAQGAKSTPTPKGGAR